MITPKTASDQAIQNKHSDFHALLIGINHYHPNDLYPNLKGCVRDIDLVSAYLQNALNIPEANIWKLTGTAPNNLALNNLAPDNLAPDDLAPDDPSLENTGSTSLTSTYRNIVESFQALTEKAAPGDQVYIHYSGHGGRAKTLYPRIKGLEQSDESIVPTDFCAPGGRYLRDVELATLLKQMTDKGLIVTIVLDSCHSGGATRGDDCAIRGGEQIDFAEQPTESLVASPEILERNWQALAQGTSSGTSSGTLSAPHSAWLPQAHEYVCIAACRPSESAYEYAANGQERNGALTFWLIDTLTNNKVPDLDYRSLYECVSAKIQSRFPNQLPMLMGEENRVVFGTDLASRAYSVPVLDVNLAKRQVTLKVGLAQGISRGSRFAIYPLGTTDFLANDSVDSQRLAVVEVRRLAVASCIAAIVPPAQGELNLKAQLAAANLDVAALVGAPAVRESPPVD
ncbi:MAG: caspase family protein [Phormidesmis sp.]